MSVRIERTYAKTDMAEVRKASYQTNFGGVGCCWSVLSSQPQNFTMHALLKTRTAVNIVVTDRPRTWQMISKRRREAWPLGAEVDVSADDIVWRFRSYNHSRHGDGSGSALYRATGERSGPRKLYLCPNRRSRMISVAGLLPVLLRIRRTTWKCCSNRD